MLKQGRAAKAGRCGAATMTRSPKRRWVVGMSRWQRAQVVELLLCTADQWFASAEGMGVAAGLLNAKPAVHDAASCARGEFRWLCIEQFGFCPDYGSQCLEAAARLEEQP